MESERNEELNDSLQNTLFQNWAKGKYFVGVGWVGNARLLWAKDAKGYTCDVYQAEKFFFERCNKIGIFT